MRRVRRVRDETASAPLQCFREARRHDEGRGRCEDRVRRRTRIHLREECLLGLDRLGPALLHERGPVHRGGNVASDRQTLLGRRVGRDDAEVGEVAQLRQHVRLRRLRSLRARIIEGNVEAVACEHGGPGAADKPRADDGNLRHGILPRVRRSRRFWLHNSARRVRRVASQMGKLICPPLPCWQL